VILITNIDKMNTSDLNKTRKLFPYLNKGVVYFNHASTGPMSLLVKESINELLHLKSEGVVRLSPHFYNTKDEINKVVAELKNY
jgi:selenocysteine lyase/cysteine desulfurase